MDPSLSRGFDPMSPNEKAFFKQLGTRIARLRKSATITHVQLAETLSVLQQTLASSEVGRSGVPVSPLPTLARALSVSVESLVGEKAPPSKRGPAPKLQQQIERIQQMPRTQQRFVMQMLDTVLAKQSR
jgi:transcriptional regulator with XRE-family HTH domain